MTEPHKIGRISSFQKGIKQISPTSDILILTALNQIKDGHKKEDIENLRSNENKVSRQVIKRHLPYFTFSGIFKKREVKGLKEHSGVICIDLDDLDVVDPEKPKIKSPERVHDIKNVLTSDPYILAMFLSPSGNGLKLLIRINGEQHLASFRGIKKYLLDKYSITIDQSGSDVSRACYISYDPDIFIHDESLPFTHIIEEKADIDFQTGEVREVIDKAESVDAMLPKIRNSYDRALWVAQKIDEKELDITADYREWLEIGQALSVFGEAGRSIFHQVSQWNPDYKPGDCDRKFDNLIRTSRFTSPAKFFKAAKDSGIETRKTKELEPAAAEHAETMRREWDWQTPDGMAISEEDKNFALNNGFLEFKLSIYIARHNFKVKRIELDIISNFTVTPLFLIKSKSDPKRLYEIKNDVNEKEVVDMPANSFTTMQKFQEIMEVQGDFLMQCRKEDFHTLKRRWFRQERTAEEIKTLGYHKDGFYAFANGIFIGKKFVPIDDYGVITKTFEDEEGQEFERHYFIPALSEIYKNEETEYETEKNFIYVARNVMWKEWSELFCKVHGDNGQIAILYFVAALFRDVVYSRFKTFPHLLGFGPRGTGKSVLGWSLTYLFGKERKPFNLNSGTAPGFYRTFAQFNNAIVWFDEFDNRIDPKRQEDLKNAYDGAGHIKGDWSSGGNSNRTVSTPVKSGCYISGQELPISNPALFSRTILLEFNKSSFTQEEKDVASKLTDMETPGLSRITAGLTIFRDKVIDGFQAKYEEVNRKLKKHFQSQNIVVIERLIHNNSILLAMYEILRNEIDFPFTDKEIWDLFKEKLYKHSQLFSKSEETNQFWDMVQYLYNMGQISDQADFRVRMISSVVIRLNRDTTSRKSFEKPKNVLFVSLSRVHGLYQKTMRERGEKGMDKESLCHYLEHSQGYIGAVNKVNYGNRSSSGYAFDYDMIAAGGINLQSATSIGNEHDDIDTESDDPTPPNKDLGKQEDLKF